jgi:hypothetical protein
MSKLDREIIEEEVKAAVLQTLPKKSLGPADGYYHSLVPWVPWVTTLMDTITFLYPGYHGSLVTTKKSRYDQFSLAANDWGTMHPILDMAQPLLAEDEGLPT